MKRFLFVLVLVVFSYSCKEEQTTTEIEVISPEEMHQISQIEDVQLVDVRRPEEYQEGYIEGFQNIDFFSDTFAQDIEELDRTKPIIVYCKSGRRSANSAKILKEKGFVKIYDLGGGITKWVSEGHEVKMK